MESKRDWGYAPEFCEGMWRILQMDSADDFVLATGETHTIREFCELTFRELGIEIGWEGSGEKERGIVESLSEKVISNKVTGRQKKVKAGDIVIEIDPKYYRPTEVDLLIGDASKAKKELGWESKVKFEELVKIMIKADLEKVAVRGF